MDLQKTGLEREDVRVSIKRRFRRLLRRSHKVILPGVKGASLYEVSKFFFTEISKVKVAERTAAVTYNFIMALPPTFLFLFSLIPYLPLRDVEETILRILVLITPNNHIYQSVSNVVTDFMHTQRNDVLSFGLLLVLFFSSNGMLGLMRGFDSSIALYKKRSGLQRRWTAIKLTLMLMLVGVFTLYVLVLQNNSINEYVLRIFPNLGAIKLLSYIILTGIIFITYCLIYTYGPSLTQRLPFVSVGAVFSTLASLLTTSVFYFLVDNFLNYNKIYGSIGTLIAFMVLVWLNILIILLGFELNISIILGKLFHENNEE